jgi:hypothetical protein
MKADKELTAAFIGIVDKIDESIRAGGYNGPQIKMYVAGGLAANYYTGARFTHDIDASFSSRIALPPAKQLCATYKGADGKESLLYFDNNYNTTFALIHPDFENDAREWAGCGNERRLVQVFVFSPVDLAVSKISRFSPDDSNDIDALAAAGLISDEAVRNRAMDAMDHYIGNKRDLLLNLDLACRQISRATAQRNLRQLGPPDIGK